jgi:hypothetical protein
MNELKQASTTPTEKNYFEIKKEEYFGDTEKTTRAVKKAFPDLINIMFNPVTIGIFIIFALVKPELLLTSLVITFLFAVGVHCYRQHKVANEHKPMQLA